MRALDSQNINNTIVCLPPSVLSQPILIIHDQIMLLRSCMSSRTSCTSTRSMLTTGMVFTSILLQSLFAQVIVNLVASRDEQVGQGFLDAMQARAAGEEDVVG